MPLHPPSGSAFPIRTGRPRQSSRAAAHRHPVGTRGCRQARAPSGRRLLCALLAGTLLGAPAAATPEEASPPHAALEWRSPAATDAEEALRLAERELDPWRQVDYTARARPLLRYREYPEDAGAGALTGSLGVSAQLRIGSNPLATARQQTRVVRARNAAAAALRRGIRDALLAHAALLQQQEALAAAAESLAEAERGAAEALAEADRAVEAAVEAERAAAGPTAEARSSVETGADGQPVPAGAGAAARRARERAELAVAAERLAFHQAEKRHRDAVAAAAAHGLAPRAAYAPLRFDLPAADPARSPAYRLLTAQAAEADAALLTASTTGILDDLRVGVGYRTRGWNTDFEGGLLNGRLGANLNLNHPGGRERWEVRLNAELVLGRNLTEFPALRSAAEAAWAEVAAFPAAFATDAAAALEAALLAEEAVVLAQAETDLAEGEAAELVAALAAARRDQPGADLARLERDSARAATAAARARGRLYRAWIDYIRRTYDYLELTGSDWRAR